FVEEELDEAGLIKHEREDTEEHEEQEQLEPDVVLPAISIGVVYSGIGHCSVAVSIGAGMLE
ncbi:MAG: hypothetical protein HGA84_07100, partial [Syntrophobacteraceae bacterium]|nr:hypothetical protein [Syntrophobacteraceae bacterium]